MINYELDVRCEFCDRYLKLKARESSSVVITCSDRKCRKENVIKIIMVSEMANG